MKMKKNLHERLSARRLGRPAPVIYPILVQAMRILYEKKLGMRFERRVDVKSIKGPFIVVGNHASRLDYLYMAFAMKGHRLNFVAGYNEFFRAHLKFILRFMNVIPKKNFTPDMYAMREMRRIIKKGGALAIFPEGMSSISGANQPVAVGSGTFIKLMGVPVYMTRISGGYLTSTKYCLDERPGRVDVTLDSLFTAEELKAMTPAQIEDRLNSALYNDDYAWNKKIRAKYDGKGRIAHDMHTLLFKCPRCGREFSMKGEGDAIRCLECGNGARVNEYYDLIPFDDQCVVPETPRVWFDWEREQVKKEIASPDFALTEHVKLGLLPEDRYLTDMRTSEVAGEGTLTLNRTGLTYEGTPFNFHLSTDQVPTYGMCTDVSRFYTFVNGKFVEFYPENPVTEKWFMATEELHRLCGGKWQDFKK
jgi:1-acyl-sn-glycerol-3-phosphate acyltransferase